MEKNNKCDDELRANLEKVEELKIIFQIEYLSNLTKQICDIQDYEEESGFDSGE